MLRLVSDLNKEKIAIVVVGYNRLYPIQRLLKSLEAANYRESDIPLVLSIDCGGNDDLNSYVNDYKWPFGEKYVIIHEKRLGLKQHIFSCGDLTKYFKGIILLEDDIYVSPCFYNYALDACSYYDKDSNAACIALYAKTLNEVVSMRFTPCKSAYSVYAIQIAITWGQCWTTRMWKDFRVWLDNFDDTRFENIDIPDQVKSYTRAWSKYFYAFLVENGKFVVSPYESYTTNFSEIGEHAMTLNPVAQVPIVNCYKSCNFAPVNELVQYDSFMNPLHMGKYVGIGDEDLCVDLSGGRKHVSKRYLLSVEKKNDKVLNQYALALRPIEENVKKHIQGEGIFLYDTSQVDPYGVEEHHPIQFLLYYLGGYQTRMLMKVVKYRLLQRLPKKIRLMLK